MRILVVFAALNLFGCISYRPPIQETPYYPYAPQTHPEGRNTYTSSVPMEFYKENSAPPGLVQISKNCSETQVGNVAVIGECKYRWKFSTRLFCEIEQAGGVPYQYTVRFKKVKLKIANPDQNHPTTYELTTGSDGSINFFFETTSTDLKIEVWDHAEKIKGISYGTGEFQPVGIKPEFCGKK